MKKICFLALLFLTACAPQQKNTTLGATPDVEFGNAEDVIELQNLENRVIVYCIRDGHQSAEECAAVFEKQGFVKIKNIPYKTAKYDILQTDTYPTRRWRDGELTPRW